MKIAWQNQLKKYGIHFCLLYLAGFILGIFFVNLVRQNMSYGWKTLGLYLIQEQNTIFSGREYFEELLKSRGLYFGFYAVIGITAFGIVFLIVGLLWNGFLAGSLVTMFLTEYGIRGMLLGVSCFFSQCLAYFLSMGLLYIAVFQRFLKIWRRKTLSMQDYKNYVWIVLVCGILNFIGIFLEGYVNYFVIKLVKLTF
ncbi:MAG: stage II sporulation protein M [Lachnospiraceae bacterium]|jgi:hypothetical protein